MWNTWTLTDASRTFLDQTSAQSSTDSLSSATEYSQPPQQQQQQQQQPYSVQMASTDAAKMARDEEKDRVSFMQQRVKLAK
jgi:hypothetical protein